MHFFLIRTSIFFKDNKIAQPVGQVYFVVFENYKWGRGGGGGGGCSFAPRIFGQNFITLSSA